MRCSRLLVVAMAAPLFLACPDKPKAEETAPSPEPAPASQPASAAAAPGKGETPEDRDQVDADGIVRRGEKLSEAPTIELKDALERAKELDGKSVKIAGTVDQVCAKKGCWFVLRANDEALKDKTIRITSKGYRFFMPRSSVGQKAIVEGDFSIKTLSEAEAQHFEDDRVAAGGGEPQKIVGEQVELQLAAVGVEMGAGS